MSTDELTPFDQASRIIQGQARVLDCERVALSRSLGRVLAEDVPSDIDMPPFHKAAMDGYACRRDDLDHELAVVEALPAGTWPTRRIGVNQCAKIMTGGVVPEGATCVIRVEDTEPTGATAVRFTGVKTQDNICRQGEDIRAGATVLRKGEIIRPQHVALLATVGCTRPLVARRPRVGILATGNELVEPQLRPTRSQIRNSNGPQLRAQVIRAGALARYYGIVNDTESALVSAIEKGTRECDTLLLSGGVSVGELDLVPGALQKAGVRLLFKKIAVQPGMPTVFGVAADRFFFGLPGNPVSTFVIFELLVKPFLLQLMGCDFKTLATPVRLEKSVTRRHVERDSWIPVKRTAGDRIRAVEYHGSAHLKALAEADGLICMPRGVAELAEGMTVDFRPI